ncbi:hypothetical protein LBMAG27_11160 [Bacteroidota bacterium]|nr:hypothetical protein LBMAG27_11160 [Bacteroidota bacterium]
MIAPSTQTDPIDKLLTKIMIEAEQELLPIKYASFFQRTIARLVDMGFITGLAIGTGYLAFNFIRQNTPDEAAYIIDGLKQALPAFGIMLWVTLYSPLMESTGGTIGKRIMGIKMANDDAENKSPRFLTCAARAWVYLVFIMLLVIPAIASCIFVLFNDKNMTFHDKMFNMVCVNYRK